MKTMNIFLNRPSCSIVGSILYRQISKQNCNSFRKQNDLCIKTLSLSRRSFLTFQVRNLIKSNVNKKHSHSVQFSQKVKGKPKFSKLKPLSTDVIVFSHENDKFYNLLGYFGLLQMCVWIYIAEAAQQFKIIPTEMKDTADQQTWLKWMVQKQGEYKNLYSALSICIGCIILFPTLTYPRRAIKRLWLLKDRKHIRIMTYGLFGRNTTIDTPLSNMNFKGSRNGQGGYIPIKVKNKSNHFMIDKEGFFHEKELFDQVIGLSRNLK